MANTPKIQPERPNEINPVQLFQQNLLKRTMEETGIKKNKVNELIANIVIAEVISQHKADIEGLKSASRLEGFKMYFRKYNERVESVQYTDAKIERAEHTQDSLDDLKEDTKKATEAIEERIEDEMEQLSEKTEEDIVEPMSSEELKNLINTIRTEFLNNLINGMKDKALMNELSEVKLAYSGEFNDNVVLSEELVKLLSFTDSKLNSLKYNLNVLFQRFKDHEHGNVWEIKPSFVNKALHPELMKESLNDAQKDYYLLKSFTKTEFELPPIFKQLIKNNEEWGSQIDEKTIESFTQEQMEQLYEGIKFLKNAVSEFSREFYDKTKNGSQTVSENLEQSNDPQRVGNYSERKTAPINTQIYNAMVDCIKTIQRFIRSVSPTPENTRQKDDTVDQTSTNSMALRPSPQDPIKQ